MAELLVLGGNTLNGKLKIGGAKNSILPILAASILTNKTVEIRDCPDIVDVRNMLKILELLGCGVEWNEDRLLIDTGTAERWDMPEDLAKVLRSSIFMLGPIVGRFKKALFYFPGGCEIGLRPIDMHLKGLRELNVHISEEYGKIICEGSLLKGAEIVLDYPSVGATENILMAAVFAEGRTVIRNAAREPEVVDLQNFINLMGGRVWGAGSSTITIEGVKSLGSVTYKAIPDRIVAGTYLVAAAITGGNVYLENVYPEHMYAILSKLKEAGCILDVGQSSIHIIGPKTPKEMQMIETLPYPGFPTDMQAQMFALATVCEGTSIIIENVFENRFKHAAELAKMGANITIKDRTAIVRGVNRLTGADINAKDLRAGAALVLAALRAEGISRISGLNYIQRGYEDLVGDLCSLGADLKTVEKDEDGSGKTKEEKKE